MTSFMVRVKFAVRVKVIKMTILIILPSRLLG